jgi:hypothetical protein
VRGREPAGAEKADKASRGHSLRFAGELRPPSAASFTRETPLIELQRAALPLAVHAREALFTRTSPAHAYEAV